MDHGQTVETLSWLIFQLIPVPLRRQRLIYIEHPIEIIVRTQKACDNFKPLTSSGYKIVFINSCEDLTDIVLLEAYRMYMTKAQLLSCFQLHPNEELHSWNVHKNSNHENLTIIRSIVQSLESWGCTSVCFCIALVRLSHVGSILIGIAGALQLVIIPAFSARWFPNHERTTATSIVVSLNYLGIAVSFLLPNWLVPSDDDPVLQRWYIQRFMWIGESVYIHFKVYLRC